MIFARPPAVFNPYDVGTQRYSEPFLWIGAFIAVILAVLFLGSYFATRKKQLLMWAFAFAGIWISYHQLVLGGSYDFLIDPLGAIPAFRSAGMFTMLTMAFTVLIPGLIAGGLAYDKDKKLGSIVTAVAVLGSMLYVIFMILPNSNILGASALTPLAKIEAKYTAVLIAMIIQLVLQVASGILIVALPIMKKGPWFPVVWVSVGGVLLVTQNVLFSIIGIFRTLNTPLLSGEGQTVVSIANIIPFFFLGFVLFVSFGLLGTKDYGFSLPHVEFEE
jgi:hypothetical protein